MQMKRKDLTKTPLVSMASIHKYVSVGMVSMTDTSYQIKGGVISPPSSVVRITYLNLISKKNW